MQSIRNESRLMHLDGQRARRTARNERRRRNRTRGAALVEAAFMMPMFVILFFGSLYAHNLGFNYINLSRTARNTSWAYAMGNCGETGDVDIENEPVVNTGGASDATKVTMPDNPTPAATGSTAGIAGIMSKFTGMMQKIAGLFPNPDGSQAVANKSLDWRAPDLYTRGATPYSGQHTTKMTRAVTVDCNNKGQNGGAINTLKIIGLNLLHP